MSDREGNANTHTHNPDKREFYFHRTHFSLPTLFRSFTLSLLLSHSLLPFHFLYLRFAITLFLPRPYSIFVFPLSRQCARPPTSRGGILPGAWPLIKHAPSLVQIHVTATTLRTYKLFGSPITKGVGYGLDPSVYSSRFYLRRRRCRCNTWGRRDNLTFRRNFKHIPAYHYIHIYTCIANTTVRRNLKCADKLMAGQNFITGETSVCCCAPLYGTLLWKHRKLLGFECECVIITLREGLKSKPVRVLTSNFARLNTGILCGKKLTATPKL